MPSPASNGRSYAMAVAATQASPMCALSPRACPCPPQSARSHAQASIASEEIASLTLQAISARRTPIRRGPQPSLKAPKRSSASVCEASATSFPIKRRRQVVTRGSRSLGVTTTQLNTSVSTRTTSSPMDCRQERLQLIQREVQGLGNRRLLGGGGERFLK